MATPTKYFASSLSLTTPLGVAVDTEFEKLLISDIGNTDPDEESGRLVLCKLDGVSQLDTLTSYSGNYFVTPNGICYYAGYYYVCDQGGHTLVRIRARDLTAKDHFGTPGSSGSTNSTLNGPTAVTTDGQYLYIVDAGNSRIIKLDLATLTYDSKTSNINGALSSIYGIVYKREGGEALFISTRTRLIKCQIDFTYIEQESTASLHSNANHLAYKGDYVHMTNAGTADNILVFASDGLSNVTNYSDTTIDIDNPEGIAIYKDSMFIADSGNNRIVVWRRYNPHDAFTPSTPIKFGSTFFDQPTLIIGEDSLIVGDTQESSPNHWVEEKTNNYSFGWVEEDTVSSTWTEES